MSWKLDCIVKLAVEENIRVRSMNPQWEKSIPRPYYFKENCTVHINIGRATGKTKYILDNSEIGDVVFTFSEISKDLYRSIKTKHLFSSLRTCVKEKLINVNFVYIDEPSLFLKNQNCNIMDVYEAFKYVDSEPIFILLGE